MDHKIIKTELKFVFSMVKLPKNTKNQTSTFGPFFHIFGHFSTLRGRISGKHGPKFKIFAKFEFSVSDLPKKSKILPKKLFWPIFIFLTVIFDSLTFSFGLVTQPSNIGQGPMGYHWIEHMFVYILETERQIDFHAMKYQDSSKFKIVIFWRFFDLDPTWTLDLWPSNYVSWKRPWIHTYWQNFSSLALRLPVQKLLWQSALAR